MIVHGQPLWSMLRAPDGAAAAAFYKDFLGWTARPIAVGNLDYRELEIRDSMIAGVLADVAGMPEWTPFFAVDDCDATVRAVHAGGGLVKFGPAVVNLCQFAILADPAGVGFGIIQPLSREHVREPQFETPGWPRWIELATLDLAASFAFYEGLFGWRLAETYDLGADAAYLSVAIGAQEFGGFRQLARDGMDPFWMIYFNVADINAAVRAVEEGGGTVYGAPVAAPGGTWVARATDPFGALFALASAARLQ